MTTTTGVRITVDTSELDIKFLKSVEQLNAGLTKSQKALGLFYNEQGLLTNGLGQCVEGLSISQIKLGEYVDELGNVRTFQGGFTDGLSKTQIALGMYADEIGNVYNALGELVGQTARASKAAGKQLEEAIKEASAGVSQQLDNISNKLENVSQHFTGLGANLKGIGEALGIKELTIVGDFFDQLARAQAVGENIKNLSVSVKGLISNLRKAKTAAAGLKSAVSAVGGPINAACIALTALHFIIEKIDPLPQIAPLSEEFTKIEDRAKRAGKAIKNIDDVLKNGAFRTETSEFNDVVSRMNAAKEQKAQAEKDRAANNGGYAALIAAGAIRGGAIGSSVAGVGTAGGAVIGAAGAAGMALYLDHRAKKHIEAADVDYKNAMAELNGIIAQKIEASKSTTEKLEEEKNAYNEVLQYTQGLIERSKEQGATAEEIQKQQEGAAALEKQIKQIEDQIVEAKKQERQAALKAAGMLEYIEAAKAEQQKTAPTIAEFNKTVEKWKQAQAEGTANAQEVDAAIVGLKKEVARRLADQYGVSLETASDNFGDEDLNARFKEEQKNLENRLRGAAISLEDYAKQVNELREQYAKESEEKAAQDFEDRFTSGEIDAEQYQALDKALKDRHAAELQKQLAKEKDATKAVEEWTAAHKRGKITQEALNEAIEKLQPAIEEARARELEAEAQAKERNVSNLSKEIGVDIPTIEEAKEKAATVETPTFKNYKEKYDKLKEALDSSILTQEQHAAAVEKLKEAARASLPGYVEAMKAKKEEARTAVDSLDTYKELIKGQEDNEDLTKETREAIERAREAVEDFTGLNADNVKEETAQALEAYNDAVQAAAEAFKNEAIDVETRNALISNAAANLAESIEKQNAEATKAAQEQRQAARQNVGIDSLIEELKTPLEKYRETLDRIDAAIEAGAISDEETTLLEQKAMEDYWKQMDDLAGTAQKGAEKLEKIELGKSAATGSESLYLAMVKNSQVGFQNRIQQTTGKIAELQTQTLSETQTTNYLLSTLIYSDGPKFTTFRG